MILSELPPGVVIGKRYRDYVVLSCSHDGAHQAVLPSGEMWCSFCKVTEARSEAFALSVYVFATLAADFDATPQAALF